MVAFLSRFLHSRGQNFVTINDLEPTSSYKGPNALSCSLLLYDILAVSWYRDPKMIKGVIFWFDFWGSSWALADFWGGRNRSLRRTWSWRTDVAVKAQPEWNFQETNNIVLLVCSVTQFCTCFAVREPSRALVASWDSRFKFTVEMVLGKKSGRPPVAYKQVGLMSTRPRIKGSVPCPTAACQCFQSSNEPWNRGGLLSWSLLGWLCSW